MINKNEVSKYSKIKVEWSDRPENYSKDAKNKIKNHFANKYGVNKNNVTVIYKPVKINNNGELIEVDGAGIDNIMDINYQRVLMKELISRDGKVVDFNRIIALDDKVNAEINVDLTETQHKKWNIKWIMIDNFLSFGENNYVPINKLNGLTVVNSSPSNMGGKTTLTIDSMKFLLHGSTTKTDKNEQIFNSFSGKNEVVVKGMIEIDGHEFIIERKLKRTAKKTGEWTVVSKVNYYEILPDGEEKMLNEEDAKRTTIKLRETIGTEKDFEMLVLATERNLDDMIGLTTTESGKVLTRLIGLEILEQKEAAVRIMYNEFSRKKKSNDYDIVTLTTEIEEHNEKINQFNELEVKLNDKLTETKVKIEKTKGDIENYISSKEKIDVTISTLNPETLNSKIEELTKIGKTTKEKITNINTEIDNIGELNFDEDEYHELNKKYNKKNSDKAVITSDINRLKKVVKDLIAGGICQSCNRKLDDVDNTSHINKHNDEIEEKENNLLIIEKELKLLTNKIESLNEVKVKIDKKNKLELDRDRLEVEIDGLRNKVIEKKNELTKYNLNLDAIQHNKNVEILITKSRTDLNVLEVEKDDLIKRIERVSSDITNNKNDIQTKTKLIETIKKEEEIEKIFKIYIELVGKKGISKLVLRSVLPIINSEVQRLLEDVCDFEVEIYIDEKNDVQFLINKDDTTKLLKSGSGFEKTASSLALRSVLGKVSTLPMPNFITFDEVLGKVAPDNIEKLKALFDKIKTMYDIVFLITHNDMVKDWANNVITVTKNNNISNVIIK
jgi:DNA repair exonuclease SbcCD ATPase subunit